MYKRQGVVITALVIPVKETLPKEAREQGSFWRSFEGFALVCKVPNFAVFTTVFGLGMGEMCIRDRICTDKEDAVFNSRRLRKRSRDGQHA